MTAPVLRLRQRLAVAEEALDPSFGAAVARRWVEERHPGQRLLHTRTHTALYRGDEDLSVRVSAAVGERTAAMSPLTLLVRIRAGTVSTTAFPDDPALPTLATMLDPVAALPILAGAVPTVARNVAMEPRLECQVSLVHHPRTGACVLRYDMVGPDDHALLEQVYAKVYPSVDAMRAAAVAHEAVGSGLLAGGPSGPAVRLPRLLGSDEEHRAIFLESLGPVDPRADGVPADEGAKALRSLHDTRPARTLPQVDPSEEVARVRGELALARTIWPDLADLLAPHVDAAAEALTGSPAGPHVLCHGDFTPSQLVRLAGSVGLLDLDTLRMAEAASDLGRYLAYAELRMARHGPREGLLDTEPEDLIQIRSTFLTAYQDGTAGSSVRPDRVQAYRSLHLALIALRAARRFKEERVQVALTLLDHPYSPDGVRE